MKQPGSIGSRAQELGSPVEAPPPGRLRRPLGALAVALTAAIFSPSSAGAQCTLATDADGNVVCSGEVDLGGTTGVVSCVGFPLTDEPFFRCVPSGGGCPLLFPRVTCFDQISEHEVVLYLGITNMSSQNETPSINFFIPSAFTAPSTFEPGFTPRVIRLTVDTRIISSIRWFVGCATLDIVPMNLSPTLTCSSLGGPPGPQGEPGASAFAGCQKFESAAAGSAAVATCPEGSVVLTGGGECDNTLPLHPTAWEVGQIQSSFPPDLVSWRVTCRIGHATAHAICCEAP